MRIVASQVEASSRHLFERSEQRLQIRADGRLPATQPRTAQVANAPRPQTPALPDPAPVAATSDDDAIDVGDRLSAGVSLLKALVEAMTGKRIETCDLAGGTGTASVAGGGAAPAGGAVTTVSVLSVSEYEYLDVSFAAQLQTADGSRLRIDLSFTMERSFQFQSISARSTTTDPLLLNFDGRGARIAGTFEFDLNSDGNRETLAALAPGSAWLALDRNGNGRIDDGSELFGPNSGDGFAELAQYDDDGNGFIDSGDAIFSQLRLFRPGGVLETLAQRDVGAIFLGAIDSPFRFNDAADRTLAQLRATSFYASHSGNGGLVQQLDLSV